MAGYLDLFTPETWQAFTSKGGEITGFEHLSESQPARSRLVIDSFAISSSSNGGWAYLRPPRLLSRIRLLTSLKEKIPSWCASPLPKGNVAHTRELYERSKNTLHAVLEGLEKSCEGAVALNRKIIDIAERNLSTGFDLAMSLAGAKNLAKVMNLQADYCRKQFANFSAQAEELRALSTEVSANVAEPVKAQVTPAKNP